ncbi:hypothetical protein [Streptomyces hokutonensis]|uniref:hypothetical protein n=1 Tax=Streptomyces hokutonensis TaxID=1306990 RepID=UPI00035D3F4F|nr:hypothetical protein [Streptomyces hokutonensis]
MTETLTSPAVVVGADSPLAVLFDIALEIGTQGEDEQREDAKTAALHHVWSHYPDTLGKAVDEDDWTGWPALPEAGLEPCAVAYLDGGWWLHHTTDGDQERDVLTLIAPCTCGNGYVDTALDGEWDLLEVLNDLRATGGRFPHHSDRPDCGSRHRLGAWGDTRP